MNPIHSILTTSYLASNYRQSKTDKNLEAMYMAHIQYVHELSNLLYIRLCRNSEDQTAEGKAIWLGMGEINRGCEKLHPTVYTIRYKKMRSP
jgi:hypothetical protein